MSARTDAPSVAPSDGVNPPAASDLVAIHVPVDQIRPNPYQPRRTFDERSLLELGESLKSAGMIQPVVVREVDDHYELIAGERRLRAARLAGLTRIPVLVRPGVDAVTQAQMALIENIQREDLNPMDRAEAYARLLSQLGLSQAELASRLGEERSSVANFVRLVDLCPPVRQLVRDGRLPVGHAKVLAGVADPAEQEQLANLVVGQSLSVRNLERLLEGGATAAKGAGSPSPAAAHLVDLEKNLARELGMRVQLRTARGTASKGRLVIHYANLDQFDHLLQKLGVQLES